MDKRGSSQPNVVIFENLMLFNVYREVVNGRINYLAKCLVHQNQKRELALGKGHVHGVAGEVLVYDIYFHLVCQKLYNQTDSF